MKTHTRPTVLDASTLPERLNTLLAERWPIFRDRIVASEIYGLSIPATHLLKPGAAEERLGAFSQGYPGGDAQALASLWTYWYLVTTWPPLIISIFALGAAPALRLHQVSLLFDDQACPAGLKVSPKAYDAPAEESLHILIHDQTAPVLEAIATAGGVSSRVLWSNAAAVLAWTVNELRALVDERTLVPARSLLASRYWADGTANPLFMPVASAGHSRRICCLGYRLEGLHYCLDCPVPCRSRL